MRVLVACEYSGVVRDAFIRRGHDAISCDLLPSESDFGPHYQGDVFDIIDDGFDMMIAHPPCTYLCNSGVRWLHEDATRWPKMIDGAVFFRRLLVCGVNKVAIENPIMHKYAKKIIGRQQDLTVQPWQFGHGETKATCLWLKGLSKLKPTNIVDGRDQNIFKMPPSKDRGKLRSKSYTGIAEAMADQWGKELRQ